MEKSEALKLAGLAGIVSFGTLSKTAILDHRIWTHDSLSTVAPSLEKLLRVSGSHLTDTKRWASVHEIHHSTPDANLMPFVELADYLDWRELKSPRRNGQAEIPETIYGLDPVLEILDVESARHIGRLSRKLVEGRYQPRNDYSSQQSNLILQNRLPRYFYEDAKIMKTTRKNPVKYNPDNLPSLHDIRFLLRDPHSPALHRKGLPGILLDNVGLYKYAERNFEDPAFRSDRLKPDDLDLAIREHRGKIRLAYVALMAAAAQGVNPARKPEQIVRNFALGSATSGAAVLLLLAGGNITNAFGHAGNMSELSLQDFLDGKVHPKADGTYTNNSKLLSPATLDEVGGQEIHHDRPDRIAYTDKRGGWPKFREAPFGTIVETMAKNGILLTIGNNFTGVDHRPDEPSSAVLAIQEARKEYISTKAA